MGLASNTTKNLLPNGRGYLFFKRTGASGAIDMGETPKFEVTPNVKQEAVYSSRAGVKEMIDQYTAEKGAESEFEIIEYDPEKIDLLMFGDGVRLSSQIAGALDGQSVSVIGGQWVDLGKYKLTTLRILHGTVTDGPFTAGETITGGTSSKTAKVAFVGTGYLACISASGAFTVGETITGGTSSASAVASAAENISEIVVANAASPTTRYALGTDYEAIPTAGKLFVPKTGSAITLTQNAGTVYVWADVAAMSMETIYPLKSSYVEGLLEFVGNPDRGPVFHLKGWKCRLTIGGGLGFINDGHKPIPVKVEYLSDRVNHPDYPYFWASVVEYR